MSRIALKVIFLVLVLWHFRIMFFFCFVTNIYSARINSVCVCVLADNVEFQDSTENFLSTQICLKFRQRGFFKVSGELPFNTKY